MFNIILATDENYGIGKNNTIPWTNISDLKLFKSLTESNELNKVIIMGHNTMKSLKNGYLKNRINIVITSENNKNYLNVDNFDRGLEMAYSIVGKDPSRIWVIGGGAIYKIALNHIDLNLIYHSQIKGSYDCDVKIQLPQYDIISQDIISFQTIDEFIFRVLKRNFNNVEYSYLQLLKDTLINGKLRPTRNANTLSLFGKELVFNVTHNFPLLTTKKMFLKGIVEELLFFIRGDTDTNKLMEKGINIWKGNTTREFLDKLGLDYEEGMMGPMYGYQWRFFGKPYGLNEFNSIHSIDQLKNIIETLKKDPNSRRLIMTDFNPAMVDQGVLYPCHSLIIQFYVDKINESKLSIKMYQRSADLFLGLPFNIASTTLLLYIVAKLVNMTPDNVHITLGDCHIYDAHIDAVKEQLSRECFNLPKLIIPDFKTLEEVEQSNYSDYKLEDYNFHPPIKAPMIA
jgi:dihydrofolate reductase/thymidylate synthase